MHAADDQPHDNKFTPSARSIFLSQLTCPTRPFTPPLVVLVAWGADTAHATFATRRGVVYARMLNYRVRETFTSYCERMRDALLFEIAVRRFVRREIDYSRAWWLVPHSAVSLRDLGLARTTQQQTRIKEAADQSRFMLEGVTSGRPGRGGRTGPLRGAGARCRA